LDGCCCLLLKAKPLDKTEADYVVQSVGSRGNGQMAY